MFKILTSLAKCEPWIYPPCKEPFLIAPLRAVPPVAPATVVKAPALGSKPGDVPQVHSPSKPKGCGYILKLTATRLSSNSSEADDPFLR